MLANYRMKGHKLVWFSPSPPSIACFLFLVFGFRMYFHDTRSRSLVDKYLLAGCEWDLMIDLSPTYSHILFVFTATANLHCDFAA